MAKLHLVLAEASLELVPEELWRHAAITKSAKAKGKPPGEILLEDTYHHAAMRAGETSGSFVDASRRGRPDILHTTLLFALESRLNHDGRLAVSIHTRDNKLITVDPTVRIQRAQHRFMGLMEQLLLQGAVGPAGAKDPLMAVHPGVDLRAAVERAAADRVVILDEGGDDAPIEKALVADLPPNGTVAAVIGAFPEGTFQSDLSAIGAHRVALGTRQLTAWTVAAEVVVRFRQATAGAGVRA